MPDGNCGEPSRIPERNTSLQAPVCVALVGAFPAMIPSMIPQLDITPSSENFSHTAHYAQAARRSYGRAISSAPTPLVGVRLLRAPGVAASVEAILMAMVGTLPTIAAITGTGRT